MFHIVREKKGLMFASVIEGRIDQVETGVVSGWAWLKGRGDTQVVVEARIQGKTFARATANIYRSDLRDAGIGSGRHSFALSMRTLGSEVWQEDGDVEILALAGRTRQRLGQLAINSLRCDFPRDLNGSRGRGRIENLAHGTLCGYWICRDMLPRLAVDIDGEPGPAQELSIVDPGREVSDDECAYRFHIRLTEFGKQRVSVRDVNTGENLLAVPIRRNSGRTRRVASSFDVDVRSTLYGAFWARIQNHKESTDPAAVELRINDILITETVADWVSPEDGARDSLFVRVPDWASDGEEHHVQIRLVTSQEVIFAKDLRFLGREYFDSDYYCRWNPDVDKSGTDPLAHYLQFGVVDCRKGHVSDYIRAPHPLFDARHYCLQQEVAETEDPYAHYIESGYQTGAAPHALFDPQFFAAVNPDFTGGDPLAHFLTRKSGDFSTLTHPLFDPVFYAKRHGPLKVHPLLHYLSNRKYMEAHASWLVDSDLLMAGNPDLCEYNVEPLQHFSHFGRDEGRILGRNHQRFLDEFVRRPCGVKRGVRRTTAIIVSHDASRTGAPLIILEIARTLASVHKIDVCCILGTGGDLEEDFKAVGPTIVCSRLREEGVGNFGFIPFLLKEADRSFALCNSAESIWAMQLISGVGLPVTGLVHEFAQAYTPQRFAEVYRHCMDVIYPADLVMETAFGQLGEMIDSDDRNRSHVIPQGLIDEGFLDRDHVVCRSQLRAELGLEPDTFIALGCGYIDSRKGCDIFVSVAKRLRQIAPDKKIAFVWVGGALSSAGSGSDFWLQHDVKAAGLEASVHFVGGKDSARRYFFGSDVFLMLSRLDPFPCVVHEAMASRLPVIAFENASGATGLIRENGILVDYLDVQAVCEQILRLSSDTALRDAIGTASRDKIVEEYRFDVYVEDLLDLVSRRHFSGRNVGAFTRQSGSSGKKVFFVCSDWSLSGVNTGNAEIARHLQRKGWEPEFVFTQLPEKVESATNLPDNSLLPSDVTCRYVDRRDSLQSMWDGLQDLLEEHAPCIMVTAYDYYSSCLSPALSDGVGVVGVHHSDDVEHYEHTHRLARYWNRTIAVSHHVAHELEELNPAICERLTVIPNSMVSQSDTVTPREARRRGPVRLIYTGRLVDHQKRVRDFVPVIRALEAREIDYQFSFYGSDLGEGSQQFLEDSLASQIERGVVQFFGRVAPQEVKEALLDHDIFLLLSDFEGLPQSVLEAMAFGCVPIVTDITSGIPELIDDGVHGYVVQDRSWDALAEKVEYLAANRDMLANLSSAARTRIREGGFTIESVADKYDDVIRRVFSEISGNYRRPQTLAWNSPVGDILLPQSLQQHPDG